MKILKGFICGFILCFILMANSSVLAQAAFKTIQVVENVIKIKLNENLADVQAFVYNDRTYVQVRTIGELLGKNVSWEASTGIICINDKVTSASLNKDFLQQPVSRELSTKDIAKKENTIVLIKAYDDNGELIELGSGFIITSDGIVVTNFHVISGAGKIEVIASNQKTFSVASTIFQENKDVALLQLQDAHEMPFVTIGDSDTIQLGEKVVTISNPQGLNNVVSDGIVSTVNRFIDGNNYIQITAPISNGSSGGALFNSYGEVIGITTCKLSEGDSIYFAVPINDIKKFITY